MYPIVSLQCVQLMSVELFLQVSLAASEDDAQSIRAQAGRSSDKRRILLSAKEFACRSLLFTQSTSIILSPNKFLFALFEKLVRLDDVACDGRRRDDVRAGEIDFAGVAASRNIAILCADCDLT